MTRLGFVPAVRQSWETANLFGRIVLVFSILAGGMAVVAVEFVALFLFGMDGVAMATTLLGCALGTALLKWAPTAWVSDLTSGHERLVVSACLLLIAFGAIVASVGRLGGGYLVCIGVGILFPTLTTVRR